MKIILMSSPPSEDELKDPAVYDGTDLLQQCESLGLVGDLLHQKGSPKLRHN